MVEEGRITGLCPTKYGQVLKERARDTLQPLNKKHCLQGIEAVIRHFNSLGLVHDYINSANIMFLDDDTPIIIDFDSCCKEGEGRGMKGAAYNSTDEKYGFVRPVRKVDFSGLRQIRQYLDDPEPFGLR